MLVNSLGYRTDLMIARFDSELIDREDFIVVRTPSNPTFHWGNYVLFKSPPKTGDLETWTRIFEEEVGRPPKLTHTVFGWDTVDGDLGSIEPIIDAGFRPMVGDVMVATTGEFSVPAPTGYHIRALETDGDWQAVVDNHVQSRDDCYEQESYRTFSTRQFARYRAMALAGLGQWFGAFKGDELAGDLGLFSDGVIGRYQSVVTNPAHRRRGVCRALVAHAARHAFTTGAAKTLVIVADEDGDAGRIYHRLGFLPVEKQVGAERT